MCAHEPKGPRVYGLTGHRVREYSPSIERVQDIPYSKAIPDKLMWRRFGLWERLPQKNYQLHGRVNLCLDLLVDVIEADAFFKRSSRLKAEK
jgi:hypothetical protein